MDRLDDEELLSLTPGRPEAFAAFYRRHERMLLVLEDEALERIERLGGDERVVAWLERLPTDQAQAVRARVIDEEPYSLIAARVRCSESVVRQRVSRGLGRLRSIVKEDS
jgi:RNA polymerase sigma factor (sigma-70 family)